MNIPGGSAIASCLLLAFLVVACGGQQFTLPARGTDASNAAASAFKMHIEKAAEYEQEGALVAAIREYRIAGLISHEDRSIKKKTADLMAEVDRKAAESRKAATAHRKRGRIGRERRAWLAVLSYKPDDKAALSRLRAMEQAREKRSLARKIKLSQKYYNDSQILVSKNIIGFEQEAFEYSSQALWEMQRKHAGTELFLDEMQKHLGKYPEDEKIRALFITTCIKEADKEFTGQNYENSLQYLSRGGEIATGHSSRLTRITQVKKRYADELYAKGLEAYRDDRGRAIDYWRLALKYNPQMGKARLRLRKMSAAGGVVDSIKPR